MRFVSMSPRLMLGTVVKELFDMTSSNELFQTRKGVDVMFTQEYLTQADIDFALQFFPEENFRGRWLEADEITQEPLAGRIGVFDTVLEKGRQDWDDETVAKVEEFMLSRSNLGHDYALVEKIAGVAVKPWPSYDEAHHFKIPALAAELGLLDEALAYEQANKNRDSVISGIEEKLAIPADAATGEVVAA